RTPMNAILGFSELLRTQLIASKERQYLDAISSSGKTLLTLINDILDLSKIEAGKLELQYEPTSVAKIVEEIQKLFSLKAGEKGAGTRDTRALAKDSAPPLRNPTKRASISSSKWKTPASAFQGTNWKRFLARSPR